jgi:hypothetical protein
MGLMAVFRREVVATAPQSSNGFGRIGATFRRTLSIVRRDPTLMAVRCSSPVDRLVVPNRFDSE